MDPKDRWPQRRQAAFVKRVLDPRAWASDRRKVLHIAQSADVHTGPLR